MDESSHVFLIKDKIRCIQKKIMDQLAADLNSALNDADILTSSLSNVPITSSSSATISKIKRRRKRPTNNEMQQQKTEASDSTTPENSRYRNNNNKQSGISDGDDAPMPSKTQSSLAVASGSDSASLTDEIRRRRRPFKKPIIPSTLTAIPKTEQPIKFTRCPSMRVCNSTANTTTIATPLRRRRRNCRSEGNSRTFDIDEDPSTTSSSSFSLAINNGNYVGKRKRSRAIIHDDFRLRTNSLHDYDMICADDVNLTNFSSSSSLNLSDSDKDPCLTSNEADDEQSDWPRDESSVPRVISCWEDNEDEKSDDDDDEKMLTTTDGALQKIVNGALNMMLVNSKNTIQNRIKTYVHREMLTGNRRNIGSKNAYTHPHPKRHVRLLKEARRSHHNSYSHKRVKSDHYPYKHNDTIEPIDPNNIGHQLLEKIGWTPSNSLNQNGISAPVQINHRNHRHENTSMDTSERMESEQSPSLSSHPSHV